MEKKTEKADVKTLFLAREIVKDLTPEQCKWWLLNRAFANDFPDVNDRKQDRISAARGQELLYDQLVADHGWHFHNRWYSIPNDMKYNMNVFDPSIGSYICQVDDSLTESKENQGLQKLNKARDHDGIAARKRLPSGATFTPIPEAWHFHNRWYSLGMETINTTPRVKVLTNTKKKQFWFTLTSLPQSTNSYFDGGSRDQYTVINVITGRHFTPESGHYPWTTKNDYTLQSGDVLMVTGMCCGKPRTPHFMCLPEDNQRVRNWLGI
jgi:hypothetical protein